jgi:hypothetical protein
MDQKQQPLTQKKSEVTSLLCSTAGLLLASSFRVACLRCVSLHARTAILSDSDGNGMEGSTLHRIIFITVGLVLMVVLHLVVAICVLSRACPSRRVAEHAEEESGGAGLSAEEVGQLPCHEFKEGAGGGECVVCLDVFRSGDRSAV